MQNQFGNRNLQEIHHINLGKMEGNDKNFLVKLQNLAIKVYSTPANQPVAPADGTVVGDKDRYDRETRENDNRRNFAQLERKGLLMRLFKKAMPILKD